MSASSDLPGSAVGSDLDAGARTGESWPKEGAGRDSTEGVHENCPGAI